MGAWPCICGIMSHPLPRSWAFFLFHLPQESLHRVQVWLVDEGLTAVWVDSGAEGALLGMRREMGVLIKSERDMTCSFEVCKGVHGGHLWMDEISAARRLGWRVGSRWGPGLLPPRASFAVPITLVLTVGEAVVEGFLLYHDLMVEEGVLGGSGFCEELGSMGSLSYQHDHPFEALLIGLGRADEGELAILGDGHGLSLLIFVAAPILWTVHRMEVQQGPLRRESVFML